MTKAAVEPSENVELHPHRCEACGTPWASTEAGAEDCPFCGESDGRVRNGAAVNTAARAARARRG